MYIKCLSITNVISPICFCKCLGRGLTKSIIWHQIIIFNVVGKCISADGLVPLIIFEIVRLIVSLLPAPFSQSLSSRMSRVKYKQHLLIDHSRLIVESTNIGLLCCMKLLHDHL